MLLPLNAVSQFLYIAKVLQYKCSYTVCDYVRVFILHSHEQQSIVVFMLKFSSFSRVIPQFRLACNSSSDKGIL